MKHCVLCWLESSAISEATYVYDGMSLCRRHLSVKRELQVPNEKEKHLKRGDMQEKPLEQEDMIRWQDE